MHLSKCLINAIESMINAIESTINSIGSTINGIECMIYEIIEMYWNIGHYNTHVATLEQLQGKGLWLFGILNSTILIS